MQTTIKVRKKLLRQFEDITLSGDYDTPPVLINCLYGQLMIEYMRKCGLLQSDIRAIMILSVFEGQSRNKIIAMSGMHHQSLYPIFDRLIETGYAYTDESRPKRIYLTYGGKEIVTDVNRLWADIVCLSKRKMDLKLR